MERAPEGRARVGAAELGSDLWALLTEGGGKPFIPGELLPWCSGCASWHFQGSPGQHGLPSRPRARRHGGPAPEPPWVLAAPAGSGSGPGGPCPPVDGVATMRSLPRRSRAVRSHRSRARAVPCPPHLGVPWAGAWGCSYLTVITNCGGSPSPFSARPRGRRRRFSGGLAANNSSAASAHYLCGAARTCSGWENLGQWVSQAVP